VPKATNEIRDKARGQLSPMARAAAGYPCPSPACIPNRPTVFSTDRAVEYVLRGFVANSNENSGRTPQQTADRVRAGMFEHDHASKAMGMRIADIAPGRATVAMTVRQDMLNGHQICHGGLIATLADTAFAFACNSYNEMTVASGFAIDLIAPGRLGDVLSAHCTEVSKAGRTGVYDAEVTNQRGERVAVFRGRSYTIKGKPAVAD
jgi:acyl-CoA thioesterase